MTIGRIPSVEGGIQSTIFDAAGDLLYATAADTPARLAIGSTGQVLKVSGGLPSWGTDNGKVLQVVMGSTSTMVSSSSTSFVDTNLTASITPSLATSKVLILVSQNGCFRSNGNADNALKLKLFRGATELAVITGEGLQTDTALRQGEASYSISYLDTPSTTSATTYKTQFANKTAAASVKVQEVVTLSTIILLEIGA
jgi:hypothetical protein